MSDIRGAFPKAKVLNGNRVRFEIAGGQYRLIAAFDFEKQIAFVKFLGTHQQYDTVDALTVSRSRRLAVEIRPILSDADRRDALQEIERLWGSPLGTPDGDRLDVLATLVEAYEEQHFLIAAADPIEILHFAITDMGRSQSERARLLGSRARIRDPEPEAGAEPRPDPGDQRGLEPADRAVGGALSPGRRRRRSAHSPICPRL